MTIKTKQIVESISINSLKELSEEILRLPIIKYKTNGYIPIDVTINQRISEDDIRDYFQKIFDDVCENENVEEETRQLYHKLFSPSGELVTNEYKLHNDKTTFIMEWICYDN